ncbi:T7SS effector LXG polymorphic toxin [Carnobacterium divergens]|uniref:T7SS effector LXG polymorphic toxin n=1 Tax=Carnobacterium divergens TaxID=2748 RepID=UPI0039AEDE15
MGLVYSNGDSSSLMSALSSNLATAKSTVSELKSGSQRLTAAVDGRTLSGAAYNAGKGLFSELILPTIGRVTTSMDGIQNDLVKYTGANAAISSEGYLNEDNLKLQIQLMKASKSALTASADTFKNLATVSPIPGLKDMLNHAQERLNRMANSMQDDIDKLQKKIKKLHDFSNQTNGLFSNSLNEMKIAMQGVLVLSGTTVNSDGSYSLPSGTDKSWFSKMHPNSNKVLGQASTNAYLELYKQTEALLKPVKGGKTDNIKRFEMLLKLYPASVVKKLLANDEFWMLANKLPSGWQTKLINGLAKYETFGQAVIQGKWIPKVDTLGKAFENFNKFTNPIKTWVGESLKNSQFVQGAKQWGVAKGLGKAATVATYAQLGVTFVSSGVDNYGKTGSIGKGAIGGAIDTLKSVGPLEGMTIGAAAGGPVGAVVGGVGGLINVGVQFIWPNAYDNLKDGAYKLYDKGVEAVGKGVSQGVESVKNVCKNVENAGKSIGKVLSSVKLPEINFGW